MFIVKTLFKLILVVSSNINGGIKAVLFLKQKDFTHTQKAQNANKQLSLRCFYAHKNTAFFCFTHKKAQKPHKKHKNANKQIGDFCPLRCVF